MELERHVSSALTAVVAAIAIAIAFGIGLYIVNELNRASGGNLNTSVQMLQNTSSMVSTTITFLLVAVVAAIGIGIVVYLWKNVRLTPAPTA